jgi:flagellar biosynthesis/type III secretory pathway M-ring protein FliF/YscJ
METQWWVVLAVLAIIVAIIGYRRSVGNRDRNAQDLRMSVQAQGQAQLPGDRISQREDRRLAGMTAEDREWEQASLQRHRESQQARTRRTEISEDTL